MRVLLCLLALMIAIASPASAQWNKSSQTTKQETAAPDDVLADAQDVFLAIFYHEFGHALIDVMDLPVLGLEEDAADVLSVLLLNQLWDAESSEVKLRAAAGFWAASAAHWAEAGEAPSNWGVHSPDERRYYTYVCLYFGADPQSRTDLAADLGLPPERAATCPAEHDLAAASWGPYLDELYDAGAGKSLVWNGPPDVDDPFASLLRDEVIYLNDALTLPRPVTVTVAACGEPNAFYDPETVSVTMCAELMGYLLEADAANM